MTHSLPKNYDVSASEVRAAREYTGLSMMECKKLLQAFGNIEDGIRWFRKNCSDEPQFEGLTEKRFDVLDKNGVVIFTCKEEKELEEAGYSHLFYRIRVVGRLGTYAYLK